MTHQLSPRANVFLLVNLGCEMLYVIDQRLQAQQVEKDKSNQVIHDITAVLLEPKFIDSLIFGSTQHNAQLLTVDHCKFMLNDIATCSLMRLDDASMGKLWNLMTMVYKWQLFVSKHHYHLLDITFRHLDSVAKLYPDEKRSMLIDFTKNTLLDFWNSTGDDGQMAIYHTNKAWLQCFDTKISLLIRLGFQDVDGSFLIHVPHSYFQEFVNTAGVNIYTKSVEIVEQQKMELASTSKTNRVQQFADMLNFQQATSEELRPMNASFFQNQFEQNLSECKHLFNDSHVKHVKQCDDVDSTASLGLLNNLISKTESTEFVQLETKYNRNAEIAPTKVTIGGLKPELIDLYSKLN